ncbi:NAD-dependent epimerase/dehydratase family protein [Halobellus sp. EA9]|uniref:NAD-dependent epimerase/dehydratase family protein n=1 Tax=Halobellus sp. EA9 TaxID=3421647 RepID=UPI003EB9561F
MAVFVTGATGLVGRHFVSTVSEQIIAGTRSGTLPSDISNNLKNVKLDLTDEQTVDNIPWEDVETVVHLGAYTAPRDSVNQPHQCFKTNASGTSALLAAAASYGVSNFINISSYWVYDSGVTGEINESSPVRVETPYGASKAAAELQCDAIRVQSEMAVTTLRPFNIYGPGGRVHQVIPEFINQAVEDGVIEPHPGNPVRDFLYVDDFVEAIVTCCESDTSDVYNVGYGEGTSIHVLAETVSEEVERQTGQSVETRFSGDPDPTDSKVADTTKLRNTVDWKPSIPLSSGIKKLTTHYINANNVDDT